MNAHQERRGYTFVELLIVITIIGILVALLLPAVQAATEAARRLQCAKHLEQLIIATQNYEMLHQVYPPGTISATGPIRSLPRGYHHNWLIQLLPYLEEKNKFSHVDDLVSVYDPRNLAVRKLQMTVLTCPSQDRAGRGYSDYAGVHHDVEAPIDVHNNGVFFLNSRISYFDLEDGSSNTFFFGEKVTRTGDLGWMSGTRATLRNTGLAINGARLAGWPRPRTISGPKGFPPGVVIDGETTEPPLSDSDALDQLFGTSDPSVAAEVTGGYAWGDLQEAKRNKRLRPIEAALAVGGFSSPHPGGSQFAIGDGSVRFISETIAPNTLRQWAHRADRRLGGDSDW